MKEKNYTLTEKELFDLINFAMQKSTWSSLFAMMVSNDVMDEETTACLEVVVERSFFMAQEAYEKLSPKAKQIVSDWEKADE